MASPVAGSKGTKVATKKVLEASKPEEISNTAKTRKASKTISTSSDDSVWKM
jgi:hypothetical protein